MGRYMRHAYRSRAERSTAIVDEIAVADAGMDVPDLDAELNDAALGPRPLRQSPTH